MCKKSIEFNVLSEDTINFLHLEFMMSLLTSILRVAIKNTNTLRSKVNSLRNVKVFELLDDHAFSFYRPFLQFIQLHFSLQASPFWKHSQQFLRHYDFEHLHPLSGLTFGQAKGINAFSQLMHSHSALQFFPLEKQSQYFDPHLDLLHLHFVFFSGLTCSDLKANILYIFPPAMYFHWYQRLLSLDGLVCRIVALQIVPSLWHRSLICRHSAPVLQVSPSAAAALDSHLNYQSLNSTERYIKSYVSAF